MVQFEYPMVIEPLLSFTFGDHFGVPFSSACRKMEMLHVAC